VSIYLAVVLTDEVRQRVVRHVGALSAKRRARCRRSVRQAALELHLFRKLYVCWSAVRQLQRRSPDERHQRRSMARPCGGPAAQGAVDRSVFRILEREPQSAVRQGAGAAAAVSKADRLRPDETRLRVPPPCGCGSAAILLASWNRVAETSRARLQNMHETQYAVRRAPP
jgi:hypothetical protein